VTASIHPRRPSRATSAQSRSSPPGYPGPPPICAIPFHRRITGPPTSHVPGPAPLPKP
jgi:hypothetical protein